MVNKKKRLFKLLFFPLSLLLCLSIFLINSFASSGYEFDNVGNLKSYNLFDTQLISSVNSVNSYNYVITNQTLILNNTDSSNNDPYIYFDKFLTLKPNTTYSMFIVTSNPIQYCGLTGYPYITSVTYNISTSKTTFTTNSTDLSFGFGFEGLQGYSYNIQFMLYEGNADFDYFPFGYYYDGGVVNNLSLYSLFNGGSAFLYWSNNMDVGFIEYDSLSLSENTSSITLNDMPTIRSYLSTHAVNDNTLYSIMISTPYNISSYANLRFTYNSNSFKSDSLSVKLSGRNDLYNVYYPTNSDNVIICNSFNLEYTDVMINGFYNYTSNSFNLSLNTFESGYYNRGYNDGYNNGLSNGSSQGYASGYQVGLNDGMNTDITTNGVKTLFNSILSFPVDMIKNVFNFDFMGVNVASVIMFIISIGIVAFVLKKFL